MTSHFKNCWKYYFSFTFCPEKHQNLYLYSKNLTLFALFRVLPNLWMTRYVYVISIEKIENCARYSFFPALLSFWYTLYIRVAQFWVIFEFRDGSTCINKVKYLPNKSKFSFYAKKFYAKYLTWFRRRYSSPKFGMAMVYICDHGKWSKACQNEILFIKVLSRNNFA